MIMECSHYRQYMKFPKEFLVAGWGKLAPFYPNFSPAAASQACIYFFKFCMLGTYNKKWTNEMQNLWNFPICFFNLRVLYCTPNLFKYFKLGQNAPSIFRGQQSSRMMIVFK